MPIAFQNLLAKERGIAFTPISGNSPDQRTKPTFAPRIGFSFQALPKLVIRGGFGMFYQGNENHGLSVIATMSTSHLQVTASYSNANAVTPLTSDNSVGSLQSGLLNVALTPATGEADLTQRQPHPARRAAQCQDIVCGRLTTSNLQLQLTPNTVLEAGYVGTGSRHVQVGLNENTVSTILAPLSANVKTESCSIPDFATGGTLHRTRRRHTDYNGLFNLNSRASASARASACWPTSPGCHPSASAIRATCLITASAVTVHLFVAGM